MQAPGSIVVVLATGGTIAGVAPSAADDLGYRSAVLGVEALLAALPPGAPLPALESEQVAQLDSKDMEFATWRRLATRIAHHAAREDVAGIVVTHGSDTLEETAYFLARTVALAKPVVLTAAMRPASSRDADGPRNLADAIGVAAGAGEAGVVAVIAGEVYAARGLRKQHPQRLAAFASGEGGPLARVAGGAVVPLRPWPAERTLGIDLLPEDPARWPWVEIVLSRAGADGAVVRALVKAGVAGIVVAATGNGTLHHALEAALREAAATGVAVLRCTRCVEGGIVDPASAAAEGLPSGGDLTPVQARVELMLRLLAAEAGAGAGAAAGAEAGAGAD